MPATLPPLQFGVLQFFSWPRRNVPLERVYARALDRIRVMDRSGGYDAVWLAEHHFNTYSVCPSVHVMGTMVAAITERLRIGTAVSIAPMYHPLRLAEEVALLDVLSGGRVNWGAGRGSDPTEFGVFGLDMASSYARFRENVDIVLRAWTEPRLTYHGEFTEVDDVEVLPKPLQQPHPPVWLASSSPDAIAWSAAQGYSILMDPHSSHGDIGIKHQAYLDGLTAHGHSVEGRVTPMARLVAVAATDDEARAVARQGAEWTIASYINPAGTKFMPSLAPAHGSGEEATSRRGAEADPVERYLSQVIVHGSAQRVIDELQRLRQEIGLHYLLCAPLSHESFVRLTDEVIPAFR